MGLNGLSKEYILMSIKPHYADLIYTERKRFEYRKKAPKLVDLPILLYETWIYLWGYKTVDIMQLNTV